jgi:hypothetical protein
MTVKNRSVIHSWEVGVLTVERYDTGSVRVFYKSKKAGTQHIASISGLGFESKDLELLQLLLDGCLDLWLSPKRDTAQGIESKIILDLNLSLQAEPVEGVVGSILFTPAEKFLAVASIAHHRINIAGGELLSLAEGGWRFLTLPDQSLVWGQHLASWLLPDFRECNNAKSACLFTVPKDFQKPGSYQNYLQMAAFLDCPQELRWEELEKSKTKIRSQHHLLTARELSLIPLLSSLAIGEDQTNERVREFITHYLPSFDGSKSQVTYRQSGLVEFLYGRFRDGKFVSCSASSPLQVMDGHKFGAFRKNLSLLISEEQLKIMDGAEELMLKGTQYDIFYYHAWVLRGIDSVLLFAGAGTMGFERANEFFRLVFGSISARDVPSAAGSFTRDQLRNILNAIEFDEGSLPASWLLSLAQLKHQQSGAVRF